MNQFLVGTRFVQFADQNSRALPDILEWQLAETPDATIATNVNKKIRVLEKPVWYQLDNCLESKVLSMNLWPTAI